MGIFCAILIYAVAVFGGDNRNRPIIINNNFKTIMCSMSLAKNVKIHDMPIQPNCIPPRENFSHNLCIGDIWCKTIAYDRTACAYIGSASIFKYVFCDPSLLERWGFYCDNVPTSDRSCRGLSCIVKHHAGGNTVTFKLNISPPASDIGASLGLSNAPCFRDCLSSSSRGASGFLQSAAYQQYRPYADPCGGKREYGHSPLCDRILRREVAPGYGLGFLVVLLPSLALGVGFFVVLIGWITEPRRRPNQKKQRDPNSYD